MFGFLKSKKGYQIGDMPQIAVMFVIASVAIVIGLDILTDIGAEFTGEASTAANNSISGAANIAGWMPTIGTVIGAAFVIGILMSALYFAFTKRGG